MNIERKSPEQLQAQVESYADSLVGSDGYSQRYRETQDIFFRYAGLLANMREGDELPENAPQELVDAVRDHSRLYVRFLRTASREDLDFRTANNRLYQETFSPLVETLKASLPMREGKIDRDALSQHPQYIGSGTNGHAFRLDHEGRAYVIKFLNYASQTNFEHKPLVCARGIPHVVQLVCFSIPDNVVITKLLPGKGMDAISEEELPTIPDNHIIQLIKTVCDLDARGIVIDPKPGNFLYDDKKGFSVLDFHLNTDMPLCDSIMSLRRALSSRYSPSRSYDFDSPERKQGWRAEELRRFKTLIQFLRLMEEHFPHILSEWKERRAKSREDRRISFRPLVDLDSFPDDAELNTLREELRRMGYGSI